MMFVFLFNAVPAIGWISYGLLVPDATPMAWFFAGAHSAYASVVPMIWAARR